MFLGVTRNDLPEPSNREIVPGHGGWRRVNGVGFAGVGQHPDRHPDLADSSDRRRFGTHPDKIKTVNKVPQNSHLLPEIDASSSRLRRRISKRSILGSGHKRVIQMIEKAAA